MGQSEPGERRGWGGGGGGGGSGWRRGGAEPRCLEGQSTLQLSVTPKIKLGRGAGQAGGEVMQCSFKF